MGSTSKGSRSPLLIGLTHYRPPEKRERALARYSITHERFEPVSGRVSQCESEHRENLGEQFFLRCAAKNPAEHCFRLPREPYGDPLSELTIVLNRSAQILLSFSCLTP